MMVILEIGLRSDSEVGDVFFGIGGVNAFLNLSGKTPSSRHWLYIIANDVAKKEEHACISLIGISPG